MKRFKGHVIMELIQELAERYAPRSFNVDKAPSGGYRLFSTGFYLGEFESPDAIRAWCQKNLAPKDLAKQEQDLFADGCVIECEFNRDDKRFRLLRSLSGWKYWLTYGKNAAGVFVIEKIESFDPRTHFV